MSSQIKIHNIYPLSTVPSGTQLFAGTSSICDPPTYSYVNISPISQTTTTTYFTLQNGYQIRCNVAGTYAVFVSVSPNNGRIDVSSQIIRNSTVIAGSSLCNEANAYCTTIYSAQNVTLNQGDYVYATLGHANNTDYLCSHPWNMNISVVQS